MLDWKDGPPPEADDGSLCVVMLKPGEETSQGFEYYGEPVIVRRWLGKLKTTVDPIRIEYDDVLKWAEWHA